jgi:hypothetical protein
MADGLLEEIAMQAISMGKYARDKKWRLNAFTELWVCPQIELDSHGREVMTWHVRWVNSMGGAIESRWCEHPVIMLAAVAEILDKAGVLPDGRR